MDINKILTGEFKNKIKKAVQNAEKKSGGEIVVFLNSESDSYNNVYWQYGFFSVFIGVFIFAVFYKFFQFVSSHSLIFLSAVFLIPLAIIILLYLIKPLRLLLIDKHHIDYYVNLKAKETFLHHEVFNTKDRTGVLIYISLFENKVVVLGDSGINKKVNKDKWDTVIQSIVKGIKNNSLADGIVSGISSCGDLLKENNVRKRIKDKNELDDNIKVGGKK